MQIERGRRLRLRDGLQGCAGGILSADIGSGVRSVLVGDAGELAAGLKALLLLL
jgi:hypothetical protein